MMSSHLKIPDRNQNISSEYIFNLDLYTRTFLHFDHFMKDPDEPVSSVFLLS